MAPRDERLVRRFVSFAKNSPWLMIALGLHVIVAAAMSVLYIHNARQKENDAVLTMAIAAHVAPNENPLPPEPEPDRQKIPDNKTRTELVSEDEVEQFQPSLDAPEDVDWHERLGDPTGTEEENSANGNSGIGAGFGAIRGSGGPSSWGAGTGKGGLTEGRAKGRQTDRVPKATKEAVLEGLRWLMRHQNDDGSWSPATLHEHCTEPACIPADPTLDTSYDMGMTALALLAFMGQGIAPGSKVDLVDTAMGHPPRATGEVVKRGIRWLLELQKADGSFSGSAPFALPENDTLPTMALCEAYALAPTNRLIGQRAQKALDYLVAAQKRSADGGLGGWGIGAQGDIDARHARGELDDEGYAVECANVDLSVTCWVVMALKSAQSCGFRVPDAALAGALAFAEEATRAEAPEAAVRPDPKDRFDTHDARRAALGMLIRTFAGGAIEDPFLERAAREIAADVPQVSKDGLSVDFYYWYFATLALNQYDGPDSPRRQRTKGEFWEPWNKGLVASLPGLQDRTRKNDVCARGGWLQEARGNRRGRALYNTALNVLTLEVYYRFENVFGSAARDSAVRGK
ncbi:MAG: hypothetical protein EXS08_04380 [Planctomycetes bacterium]|nr:hypothetical protein [Planctomycetota bacterium]